MGGRRFDGVCCSGKMPATTGDGAPAAFGNHDTPFDNFLY
jgi:hypothetical protein